MTISRQTEIELIEFSEELGLDSDTVVVSMISLIRLMRGLTLGFHGISYKENNSADV